MPTLHFRWWMCLSLALLGCRQQEAIEQYEVRYPEREQIRLLAAILPTRDRVWFFRLSGPDAAVSREREAFLKMVYSVRFPEGQDEESEPIAWTTPENWREEAGREMRHRTLRAFVDGVELETTITPLGPGAGNILSNINRWRKQINLPTLETKDLWENVTKSKVADHDVILVDMLGLGQHKVGKAGPPPERQKPAKTPEEPEDASKLPFRTTPPSGWKKEKNPQFAAEAYSVQDGGDTIKITVTPAGGDALSNVNRWRGQVGLQPVDQAELGRTASEIKVGGSPALLVDVNNPAKARIVGALWPHDGTTWFFKMMGPSEAVGRHKQEFEEFVQSLKLTARP